MSWFRRKRREQTFYHGGLDTHFSGSLGDERVPYVADNTTWTCNTCKQSAWVSRDGEKRGCGCGDHAGPRPLIADDPTHWSNFDPIAVGNTVETDSRDELIETLTAQLEMATTIATRQARVVQSARHMMDVFMQRDAAGPIFVLNKDGEGSEADIELIRHAILDLHTALNGAEPPAFCLPERTH